VSEGANWRYPPDRDGLQQHTVLPVYKSAILEICRDYHTGLPSVLSMSMSQIRWFYELLRPTLISATKKT
jgi:hypothetical protein